jgi:hypothetical protein
MLLQSGQGALVTTDDCPPPRTGYLWNWFWALRHTAPPGETASRPITWTEVKSWSELNHVRPTPGELLIIMAMDATYLGEVASVRRAGRPQGSYKPPVAG